ncbi:MAG TPA: hypothetical protein VK934_01995 [Fimbriimonas sp.]|nr:hypothetical protein [Fimbriimonas sp.]
MIEPPFSFATGVGLVEQQAFGKLTPRQISLVSWTALTLPTGEVGKGG